MKTYEEIYSEVMGRIKDQKVRREQAMKKISIYASVTAVLLVFGISGAIIYNHSKSGNEDTANTVSTDLNETNVIIKPGPSGEISEILEGTVNTEAVLDDNEPSSELAIEYDWDLRLDCDRYGVVTYNDIEYVTKLIAVHEDHMGDKIGEAAASGYDAKKDEILTRSVEIYKITGISPEAAFSVRFEDEDEYTYAYVNSNYTPKDLNEFVTDLNMKKEFDSGVIYTGEGDNMLAYEDVSVDKIWEMLLSDTSIVNEPEKEPGRKVIDITAKINVLGYHYNAMWLTEDGYLCTNLLETGKYFYIGKDKVDAFVKYVTENHQAYKYVYDDMTYDGIPE